jgi:hypothetical protein
MSFTQIDAGETYVKPAIQEKVYDKLWMESFRVISKTPQEKAKAIAHMLPYDGAGNIAPDGEKKIIVIDNLFEIAEKRADMALAMDSVFKAMASWIADNKWFDEVVKPILDKQKSGDELTDEELEILTQADNKALI